MANVLKPKRRSADATAPTTGNLADGELAVNTFSKTIYQRIGGAIVAVANFFDKIVDSVNAGTAPGYWATTPQYTFGNSTASTTGSLVIKTGILASGATRMMRVAVDGFNYASTNGSWGLTLGGYAYTNGTLFINQSYQLHGIPPFTTVQHAITPDGYLCFILGPDATVWAYPKLVVSPMNSFTGATAASNDGWTISIVADTSTYTSKVTLTRRQFAPVTIGGVSFDASANINLPGVNTPGTQNTSGSAATLTTARTIAISGKATGTATSFNGSADITIPITAVTLVAGDIPTLNQNTTGSAATLTTARTLTLGLTGKTFNGSANVSWTLAEIGALPAAGGTLTGDLTFSGTGRRLLGDFSATTVNDRLLLKSSVTNGNTNVGAIPDGTGTIALYSVWNAQDTTNAATFQFRIEPSLCVLGSSSQGTGVPLDISVQFAGIEKARITTDGRIQSVIGHFTSTHATACVLSAANSGSTLYFRPNGADTGTNQATLNSAGLFSAPVVSSVTDFVGPNGYAVLRNASGAGDVYLRPNGNSTTGEVRLTSAGVLLVAGGTLEVGYRDIPRVTGGFERGKCYAVSAGVTVNTTTTAGDTYMVYNDSASAITLTQGSGVTLRLAGTATTGNRTLAARGMATLWFNTTAECVCSGPGVT